MKLVEYCLKHGISLNQTYTKTGEVRQYFVMDAFVSNSDVRKGLWAVTDWQVATVTGGSIWFIRK